jgi:hypothetical protein
VTTRRESYLKGEDFDRVSDKAVTYGQKKVGIDGVIELILRNR